MSGAKSTVVGLPAHSHCICIQNYLQTASNLSIHIYTFIPVIYTTIQFTETFLFLGGLFDMFPY